MFSVYSKHQDSVAQIKSMLRRTMSLSTYLVFPAMVGLSVVGQPLIDMVLGDKWSACVPYLQVYCFVTMLFPMQTANMQAINAIGRCDVYLKLMIVKRALGVIILFLTVVLFNNVLSIACACFVIELISVFINSIPNIRLLNYSFSEQVVDILPNIFISLIMGAAVYGISYINLPSILLLVFQISFGFVVYILLSIVLSNPNFKYLLTMIRNN